ncbi:MAG: hypothetical protein QW514_00640 [Thermoprotei archaeon]
MASILEYLAAVLAVVLMATMGVFTVNYAHEVIKAALEFFNYLGNAQNWRPVIL